MSEWTAPAASRAVAPAVIVHARTSSSPTVKKLTRPSSAYASRMTRWSAGSGSPRASRKVAAPPRRARPPPPPRPPRSSDAGSRPLADLVQLGQARVAARHVGLGEVQAMKDRLQGQELEASEDPGLLGRQPLRAESNAVLERAPHRREDRLLALLGVRGLALEAGAELLEPALHAPRGPPAQLFLERLDLAGRLRGGPSTGDAKARTTWRSASAWRSSPTSSVARSPRSNPGEIDDLDARVNPSARAGRARRGVSRDRRGTRATPTFRRPRPDG